MARKQTIPEIDYALVRSRRGRCIHRARSVAQADVFETQWEDQTCLLKDFTARPFWVRWMWSRPILSREVRTLARLQGIEGIARLIGRAGPEAFLMERLDATRLPRRRDTHPSALFWRRLLDLMGQVHAQGIGHGDLRRKNILIGPEDKPYLIDFATAVHRKGHGWRGKIRQYLFRQCRRIDRVTLVRIKASYSSTELTDLDRKWLANEPWSLRVGRVLKRRIYRLRKPRVWRKNMKKFRRWIGL
jgi:tRNA A-37 threonylcarbamoyl transferase component Bud32